MEELANPRFSRLWAFLTATVAAVAGVFAIPVEAQRPTLSVLSGIEAGEWELRLRGSNAPAQRICLPDLRQLIQIRHPMLDCERIVVQNAPTEATVQYTCRGHGYGLTRVRRETARLIQLESQGVVDGLPFDFAAEGRRVGPCTP